MTETSLNAEAPITAAAPRSFMTTGRLEAFSDGVLAIIITLLTLELRAPTHEQAEAVGGLLPALAANWPSYLAFIVSFLFVLVMWLNHHPMFLLISHTDHTLLLLNGLLLLMISLVPFSTALFADYLTVPDGRIAGAIYGAHFLLIAFAYNAVWRYATHNRRLVRESANVNSVSDRYRLGPLMYGGAILLAFVSPVLALLAQFALAVYYALPVRGE